MREELSHHLLLVPGDPGHLQLHLGEWGAQLEDDRVSAGGLEPCWLGHDQRHPVLGEGGYRWPPEPGSVLGAEPGPHSPALIWGGWRMMFPLDAHAESIVGAISEGIQNKIKRGCREEV